MSCAKRTGARTDTPPLTRLTMSAWCSPIAERLARGGCEANRRRRRVVAPRLKFSGTSLHIARDASVSQVPRRQVRVNYVFILSSTLYNCICGLLPFRCSEPMAQQDYLPSAGAVSLPGAKRSLRDPSNPLTPSCHSTCRHRLVRVRSTKPPALPSRRQAEAGVDRRAAPTAMRRRWQPCAPLRRASLVMRARVRRRRLPPVRWRPSELMWAT